MPGVLNKVAHHRGADEPGTASNKKSLGRHRASPREWGNERLEVREFGVLAGNGHIGGINRPGDAKSKIVPAKPGIASRRIESIHLVGDLGVRFERAETVGEAHRHEELLAAIRRQVAAQKRP